MKTLEAGSATKINVKVVDTDVHPICTPRDLVEYLAEPWRTRYYRKYVSEVEAQSFLYYPGTAALRRDAISPKGGPPGIDPEFVDQQVFGDMGVDYAILIFQNPRPKIYDPEFDSALAAAHNSWMADTWLSKYNWHGRYRGSIRICPDDPEAAVAEIERWADHPYVSQISIAPEASAPYGQPQFRRVLQAAAQHRLPIGMHIIRQPGMRSLTPVGFPSYHLESYTLNPLNYFSHVASLIFEGVFDELPDLRIVCVEGGWTWMCPLMWRLDNQWRALRSEVPSVKRPPSDYIFQHVRLTTQPIEEPEPSDHLVRLMRIMQADRLLMFSSDYPHYDADDVNWVWPRLPKDARDRIMCGNAIELYDLPRSRPADALDLARQRLAGGGPDER